MKIWTSKQRNQNVDNQYMNMNLFLVHYFLLFFLHVLGFLLLSKEKNRSNPDVEFYDGNQNAFYHDCNKKSNLHYDIFHSRNAFLYALYNMFTTILCPRANSVK